MKKFAIATGVAVLAIAMVASAQGYAFNTNLTVGSTGADVVALQTWLISSGYNIASIASGAAAKGYFGSQTKAAVQAYQTANGVPSTGFVGPLTRGKLNGSAVTTPTVSNSCPAGYVCTLATGNTLPTTVNNTNGTDGSVSVSDSAFVSSGQNIKKGETKNVVAVKLQATAGQVTVSRLDVHFSVRPWLYFNQVTLSDSSGRVLATKPILSASDATEITVGSDYLVRFEGLNYAVTPGTNPDLAVGVSVLAATDKITNGMTVYAGIPTGAIRTVNGLGITDSVGGVAFSTNTSGVGARAFTLSSTGSVADISTKISSVAPASQVSQVVSSNVSTNNVTLGIFSMKSANNSATVNSLGFTVQTNPAFAETGLFSNLRMMIGSQSYGALSFTNAGVVTFTNLSIALPQDQWVDVSLVADVAATSTNVLASSTLVANTINAIDSTYTAATVGGNAMISATNNQTSANTLLTINSMSLGATSHAVGAGLTDAANGPVQRYPVSYTFTLTNSSSNSLFIATDVSSALGTTSVPTNASSTITGYFPTPTPVAGDTASLYIIPVGGSRTFTVVGTIKKSTNSSASEALGITRITYGVAGTGSTITTGLENLQVLASF